MKKIFTVILILSLIPAITFAQSIKKAQKAMDKYDFTSAIQILKKCVQKDKLHDQAVPMLAECYRMQRDIFNTKAWYASAVKIPNAKAEDFLYYGQALQATGDYSKAREMFLKYESMSHNGRGRLFATSCDSVIGPWKDLLPQFQIKNVKSINTEQSDFGAAFYRGMLVFASDYLENPTANKQYGWTGRGYLDIKKSDPKVAQDFWGEMGKPEPFNEKFNQQFHDGPACFDLEGSTVYFTRTDKIKAKRQDGYKTNLLKIFSASKDGDGDWGKIKPFFLNSPDYSVGHPCLSPDGEILYFVSDMPGGDGGTDIWMCEKTGDGWSTPTNLGKPVNTSENEMFPWISEDGTLYFSSEGHPGYGGLDIFMSKKKNGNWTQPVNIQTPVNSSFDDFAMAYAPESQVGFFSSDRPGGEGNDDIYSFIPAEKKQIAKVDEKKTSCLSGRVLDMQTKQPIEGATVFVSNPQTGRVTVLKTGADGIYKYCMEKPTVLTIKAMKPTYLSDCMTFNVPDFKAGEDIVAPEDLLLDKLEINKVFQVDNIYYDLDKYNIRSDAIPPLDHLVKIMRENPINVEMGSHTDSRASFAYNDKLSENRAKSARQYLINHGIEASRITYKGYGEYKLVNKCADGVPCSEEEHQMNRRTEFKVTSFSGRLEQEDQFNPDLFQKGEEIDIRLMPPKFFEPCD
jgi:outer membrane protein OmpA-like peptidoglycan-associated protein